MSQKMLGSKVNEKDICEAFECSATATERITLDVGQHETICLYVCKDCVSKFRTKRANEKSLQLLISNDKPMTMTGY